MSESAARALIGRRSNRSSAITDAELRLLREYLGVSGEWLADQLSVAPRTVRRWEQGTAPIPAAVAEEVEHLVHEQEQFVDAILQSLPAEHATADPVWVVTYPTDAAYRDEHPDLPWPAGWHRAAIARVMAQRSDVRIGYLHSEGGPA